MGERVVANLTVVVGSCEVLEGKRPVVVDVNHH